MMNQMKILKPMTLKSSNDRYKNLRSIDDIRHEKYLLRYQILKQESVISDDIEELKRPFRIVNMATTALSLFAAPSKKMKWIPMILSGYKIASSIVSKLRK